MGFQTKLNRDIPVGVEGDFASTNPYHTLLAGEGELKAGDNGVTVGRFAWADKGVVGNVAVDGALLGFVGRINTGLITEYLGKSSLLIPKGFGITLYDGGDFWARFKGGAKVGQKVCANKTNGKVSALNAATENEIDTGFIVASSTEANGLAKITKF